MTRTTITSRAPVAARARATRAVVVRANAQDKSGNTEATTQETRRRFARNAALLAAAAFVSVAGNNQAHADEVPEKLKKKVNPTPLPLQALSRATRSHQPPHILTFTPFPFLFLSFSFPPPYDQTDLRKQRHREALHQVNEHEGKARETQGRPQAGFNTI